MAALVAMYNPFLPPQGGANEGQNNPRFTIRVRFSTASSCRVIVFIVLVVESAVTRLLVAIKELLESLTLWSELKLSEEGVSDVYVRLGNDFNTAVHAFSQFSVDMS